MKRIIAVLLFVLVLFSTVSCSALPTASEYASILLTPYNAVVRITDGGSEYTARVMLMPDGKLDFVFAEPTLLCGIGYRFENNESYIMYNEENIPLDTAAMQSGTGICTWKEMLTPSGEYSVRRDVIDGVNTIVLFDDVTEYYFNEAEKIPVMIIRGDITVIFTEFNGQSDTGTSERNDGTNAVIPEGTGGN